MNPEIEKLSLEIREQDELIKQLQNEIGKNIVGQDGMVQSLLIGLFGNGHILLEGVPGLAKTLVIKTLASAMDASFSRIQFTPDLLPADVVGTLVFNIKENDFLVKKGPVFTHFLLADEINRAPAKVQSALLEAMQERQVTLGDETYKLNDPFLVLATQNPLEEEGTYPLPEAQADRFMLKTVVNYPKKEEELEILSRQKNLEKPSIAKILNVDFIKEIRQTASQIYIDSKIENYIVDIVFATRFPSEYRLDELKPLISFGASPRGSLNLSIASRCLALLNGRAYVIPEDVRAIVKDCLRHRIGLTYEGEAEDINADIILSRVIEKVQVP